MFSRSVGPIGRASARVGTTYYDDLQSPDNLDRDRFLLQRVPTASVDVLPGTIGLPFVMPSIDVEYTYFDAHRDAHDVLPTAGFGPRGLFLDTGVDALPDPIAGQNTRSEPGAPPDPNLDDFALFGGTEGDGIYEEGEPLTDRGHRLQLQPRVAVPLAWRGISLVPEVGWHETLYDSEVRDFRERGFVTTRVDVSTRLRRQFAKFVHVLEPRAGYALAYTHSQERNALFVPATRGAARPDPRARPRRGHARRRRPDRARESRDGGFRQPPVRLARGRYDCAAHRLHRARQYDAETTVFDALILDGRAFPIEHLDLGFHVDFDPDAGHLDEGFFETRWTYPGLSLNAGYRWARRIPLVFEDWKIGERFGQHTEVDRINQVRGGASVDLTARWTVSYGIAYSIEGNRACRIRDSSSTCRNAAAGRSASELKEDTKRGVDAKLVYRLIGLGGEPPRDRPSLLDGT
jgi:hypothetical protein